MKDKKRIFSLALVVVLILGLLPTFAFTAMAKNYEISVPSTMEIRKSGWDGVGTLSVKDQLSPGEELKVYSGSSNSFYLVNQDYPSEKIHYVMNDEPGGAEVTSWVLNKRHRFLGLYIEVADFGSMPSGTYTDTVTFFGREESSKTLITPQTMTITLTITPPARKTEPIKNVLTYTGSPQTLIIAGEAAAGSIMQYQLGDNATTEPTGDWDVFLPQGTEAKDYYVWYREYKGDHNYTQPRCLIVPISPISMEHVTVTLSSDSLRYTGSEQSVTVEKVAYFDVILKEGTDYEVSGNHATEIGTYAVTVTGKGNYSGTKRTRFTIGITPDLKIGSQGEDVKGLQVRLAALGYYFGLIDGDFGLVTKAAVKAFQTANGLYADGVVGPLTRKALGYQDPPPSQGSAPAQAAGVSLAIGSRGDEVSSLQQILTSLGYNPGGQDGYFGTYTEAAVEAFQRENGLYVDGFVGPYTWEALNSGNAKPAPADVPAGKQSGSQTPTAPTTPTTPTAPTTPGSGDLVYGMTSGEIAFFQLLLSAYGYNVGAIDGYFGDQTLKAVKAFQKDFGLYVDGVIGAQTKAALGIIQ